MARVVRQRRRLRFAKQQQRLREFSDWLHEELRPQGTQQTRALKRALLSFRMVKQKSNHALRVRFARFVRTNNVLRIHWAGLEQAIGVVLLEPFSGEARVSLAQPYVLGLRVEGDVARVFATIRIYLG
eukprot:gene4576-14757_t